MSIRFRVGQFTPDNPATFEAELRAWLISKGKLSEVEGRGLEVFSLRHKSTAGSNLMKIASALNSARSPLSTRKLLNRCTDLTEAELRRGIQKMIAGGEVKAVPRTVNRYKYFVYSLTEDGVAALERRTEGFERGKIWALEIWRVFKEQGLTRGAQVQPKAILAAMDGTLEDHEFWAGWRTLVAAGRITVAYNAEGAGKHLHFLA